MYKIMTGFLPNKLINKFCMVSEVHNRTTRLSCGQNLYIKKPCLELTKRSFVYYGAALWNSLPEHVKLVYV